MPAISQDQLNCAIYLYPSAEAARAGAGTGGSGLVVSVPTSVADWHHVYAVTNKHVIDAGCHVIRMNTHDGASDIIATAPEQWFLAPDDDLAVLPLEPAPHLRFDAIPVGLFMEEKHIAQQAAAFHFPFGYGDEVVFIGRLMNHDGKQRNRPVVRFGNIAMLPDEDEGVTMPWGTQVGFLVDCRSLAGASGSAVLAYRVSERPNGVSLLGGGGYVFMGVDCGHLPRWADVFEKGSKTPTGQWVEMNSGISVVVPAWRLRALLEIEPLAELREAEDEQLRARLAREAGSAGGKACE